MWFVVGVVCDGCGFVVGVVYSECGLLWVWWAWFVMGVVLW